MSKQSKILKLILAAAVAFTVVCFVLDSMQPDPAELVRNAEEGFLIRPSESERLLLQAIDASGGSFVEAELLLCRLIARQNRWDEVHARLESMALEECSSESLLLIGRALLDSPLAALGESLLIEVCDRSDAEQVDALKTLQQFYRSRGATQKTLEASLEIARAVSVDPDQWMSYTKMCEEHSTRAAAIAALQEGLQHIPESSKKNRMRLTLVEMLIFVGDADQAEKELALFVPDNSDRTWSTVARVWLLRLQGRSAEALKALDSIIDELDQTPETWRLHGILNLDTGNLEAAAADFRRVIQAKPNDGIAHFKLAEVYRRQRKVELMNEHLKAFRILSSENTE